MLPRDWFLSQFELHVPWRLFFIRTSDLDYSITKKPKQNQLIDHVVFQHIACLGFRDIIHVRVPRLSLTYNVLICSYICMPVTYFVHFDTKSRFCLDFLTAALNRCYIILYPQDKPNWRKCEAKKEMTWCLNTFCMWKIASRCYRIHDDYCPDVKPIKLFTIAAVSHLRTSFEMSCHFWEQIVPSKCQRHRKDNKRGNY